MITKDELIMSGVVVFAIACFVGRMRTIYKLWENRNKRRR
jgi:hypothetical protein